MNKDLEFLTRVIDEKSAKILDANDKIWEYAELAFHETKSAALLKSILKEEGFALTEGDAGIPTCFTGTFSYIFITIFSNSTSKSIKCYNLYSAKAAYTT